MTNFSAALWAFCKDAGHSLDCIDEPISGWSLYTIRDRKFNAYHIIVDPAYRVGVMHAGKLGIFDSPATAMRYLRNTDDWTGNGFTLPYDWQSAAEAAGWRPPEDQA